MTFYIVLGLSAFLISLLGTRLTILTLRKRTVLIDHPNLRSNHVTPTPRGGGIAVVITMIICMLMADVNYGVVLAMFMLAAVSLLDDLISVPPFVRLLVQIMSVSVALSMTHVLLFRGLAPTWCDHIVAGALWIWCINLFNFMDGIDGISATEMICVGAGLSLITAIIGTFPNDLSTYGLIVAASGCGFLWWNWHPAKIFLGDVGSIPIGFIIGYLLLLAATSGYAFPAAILPAYYFTDATLTLVKRLWQGKKIWQAHSEHYYQQAVRRGRKHDTVVRYIFGINLLLIFLATYSMINHSLAIFYLAIAYMAVFMLMGYFAHGGHHHERS